MQEPRQFGNLGGVSKDFHDAHHLRPWEGRQLADTQQAYEAAARGGWNINGAENGILLPENYHVNNHQQFSRATLERITQEWLEHFDTATGRCKRSDIE